MCRQGLHAWTPLKKDFAESCIGFLVSVQSSRHFLFVNKFKLFYCVLFVISLRGKII